jgi:divalent metal cation (Fe/Co/Zn/Cd) transporter
MSILRQNELSTNDRTAMIRQAFWLEYATLAWMTVEAAVAIASGIAANSLTLVAFGIDSVIELASAGVLIWRLTVELRYGQMFAENAERRASRIGGSLLFILAVYVVASAGWKLWIHQGAEFSLPGLILCVLAIPIMYFLPAVSLTSPKRLAVARSGLMQSKASPAAGSPLSWSQLSSCNLP